MPRVILLVMDCCPPIVGFASPSPCRCDGISGAEGSTPTADGFGGCRLKTFALENSAVTELLRLEGFGPCAPCLCELRGELFPPLPLLNRPRAAAAAAAAALPVLRLLSWSSFPSLLSHESMCRGEDGAPCCMFWNREGTRSRS